MEHNYQNKNVNPPQYLPPVDYNIPEGPPVAYQQNPISIRPGSDPIAMAPQQQQASMFPLVFGVKPQMITCPYCSQIIETKVDNKATNKTHLNALLLCLLCGLCCCCCVPYCVDSCRSQHHYCPNCSAFLGVHNN